MRIQIINLQNEKEQIFQYNVKMQNDINHLQKEKEDIQPQNQNEKLQIVIDELRNENESLKKLKQVPLTEEVQSHQNNSGQWIIDFVNKYCLGLMTFINQLSDDEKNGYRKVWKSKFSST